MELQCNETTQHELKLTYSRTPPHATRILTHKSVKGQAFFDSMDNIALQYSIKLYSPTMHLYMRIFNELQCKPLSGDFERERRILSSKYLLPTCRF